MRFLRLFQCASGLLLALACSAAATATPKSDREVQALANFPALQKLAQNDGTLRGYLSRVSTAYRKVGYGKFARELQQSAPLVLLFAQPVRADGAALKKARSALRDLKQALANNSFVVLPPANGTVPDYYGIAAAFVDNAKTATRKLATHKNLTSSTLRKYKGTRWLTGKDDGSYTLVSLMQGKLTAVDSFSVDGGLLKSASGTLILSGDVSWSGSATTLNTWQGGFLEINQRTGENFRVLNISNGGPWIIFPNGVEIPADFGSGFPMTFSGTILINDVEYPAGTRIVTQADSSAPLPIGAVSLVLPATIVPAPSPTPAE